VTLVLILFEKLPDLVNSAALQISLKYLSNISYADNCFSSVIACLAALRAGGAFLVLELAYPPGLLSDVLEDANPVVVVTSTAQSGHIKAEIPLIILDESENSASGSIIPNGHAKISTSRDDDDADLDRLAFVSYSSGTTGVSLSHMSEAIHSMVFRSIISCIKNSCSIRVSLLS